MICSGGGRRFRSRWRSWDGCSVLTLSFDPRESERGPTVALGNQVTCLWSWFCCGRGLSRTCLARRMCQETHILEERFHAAGSQ